MEAPRKRESLFANLFEVLQTPPKVFVAHTACVSLRQVYAIAYADGVTLPAEIVYSGNQIYTVHDPKTAAGFGAICDSHSADWLSFDECFDVTDPAAFRHASELLFKCLQGFSQSVGLAYKHNKRVEHRLFFAPYVKSGRAEGGYSKQRRHFRSGDHRSARLRSLVSPLDRKGEGKIKGLKHHAFHAEFHWFEDRWYLQISPTYFYTIDGVREKRSSADLLSGIKRLERNRAIYGNLRMWEEVLLAGEDGDLIRTPYRHLRLGPLLSFPAEIGIVDDAWKTPVDAALEAEDRRGFLNFGS